MADPMTPHTWMPRVAPYVSAPSGLSLAPREVAAHVVDPLGRAHAQAAMESTVGGPSRQPR